MKKLMIGWAIVGALLGLGIWYQWYSDSSETNPKAPTTEKNGAVSRSGSKQLNPENPLLSVFQQKKVFETRTVNVLQTSEQLSITAWQRLPNDVAYSAFQIQLNPDQSLVLDENLKNYFDYYWYVLGAVVGETEAIGRFNHSINLLPMQAKLQAQKLLMQYLTVQFSLQALHDAYASKMRAIQNRLQTSDMADRQAWLFQSYQANLALQEDKENLITQIGGADMKKLYQASNDRTHREVEESLVLTDPSTTETTKIEKIFAMYQLSPRQAMNDPAGKVRFVYNMLDTVLIRHNANLSEPEKAGIRLQYFGQEYSQALSG